MGSSFEDFLVATVTLVFKLVATAISIVVAAFSVIDVFRWPELFSSYASCSSLPQFWSMAFASLFVMLVDMALALMAVVTSMSVIRLPQLWHGLLTLNACCGGERAESTSDFGRIAINWKVRGHVATFFARFVLDIPTALSYVVAMLFFWRIPTVLWWYVQLAFDGNYRFDNGGGRNHAWRVVGFKNILYGLGDVGATACVLLSMLLSPPRAIFVAIPATWEEYRRDRDRNSDSGGGSDPGPMAYSWRLVPVQQLGMAVLDFVCIVGIVLCVFLPWRWSSMYDSCKLFSLRTDRRERERGVPRKNDRMHRLPWHAVGWSNVFFGFGDLFCGALFLLTFFTWRNWVLRRDIRNVRRREASLCGDFQYVSEYRGAIVSNALMLLLDVPFVLMMPFALLRFIPLFRRWRMIAKDPAADGHDADGIMCCNVRYSIFVEFVKVITLIITFPFMFLLLVSVYRIPIVVEEIQNELKRRRAAAREHESSEQAATSGAAADAPDEPVTYRDIESDDAAFLSIVGILPSQSLQVAIDLMCLLLFSFVLITLFRAHYTIRLVFNVSKASAEFRGLAGYRRRVVVANFLLVFLDLLYLAASGIFVLSPPRLPYAFVQLFRRYREHKTYVQKLRSGSELAAHESFLLERDFVFRVEDEIDVQKRFGPFICCGFVSVWAIELIETFIDFGSYIAFCFAHIVPFRAAKMYKRLWVSFDGQRVSKASAIARHFLRTYNAMCRGHTGLLDHFRLRMQRDVGKKGRSLFSIGRLREECFGRAMTYFLDEVRSAIGQIGESTADDASRNELVAVNRTVECICILAIRILLKAYLRGIQVLRIRNALLHSGNMPELRAADASAPSRDMSFFDDEDADGLQHVRRVPRMPRFARRSREEAALSDISMHWLGKEEVGVNSDSDVDESAMPPWMVAQRVVNAENDLTSLEKVFRGAVEDEIAALLANCKRNVAPLLLGPSDADTLAARPTAATLIDAVADRNADEALQPFVDAQEASRNELVALRRELRSLESCCSFVGLHHQWSKMRSVIYTNALMVFPDLFIMLGLLILLATVVRIVPMARLIYRHRHWRRFVWPMVGELLIDVLFLLLWAFVTVTLIYAIEMNLMLLKYIVRERSFYVCRVIIISYVWLVLNGILDFASVVFSWEIVRYTIAVAVCGLSVPAEFIQYQARARKKMLCGDCIPAWLPIFVVTLGYYAVTFVVSFAASVDLRAVVSAYFALLGALSVLIVVLLQWHPVREHVRRDYTRHATESDDDDDGGEDRIRDDLRVVKLEPVMLRHTPFTSQLVLPLLQLALEGVQLAALAVVKHPSWGRWNVLREIARYATLTYVTVGERRYPVGFWLSAAVAMATFLLVSFPLVVHVILHSNRVKPLRAKAWHNVVFILGPVLALTVSYNLAGFLVCTERIEVSSSYAVLNRTAFESHQAAVANATGTNGTMTPSAFDIEQFYYTVNTTTNARYMTVGQLLDDFGNSTLISASAAMCWSETDDRGWGLWAALGLVFYLPAASLKSARFPTPLPGMALRFHSHYNALAVVVHGVLGILAAALHDRTVAFCVVEATILLLVLIVTWRNQAWVLPIKRNSSSYVLNCLRNSVHLFAFATAIITLVANVMNGPQVSASGLDDAQRDDLGFAFSVAVVASAGASLLLCIARITCFRDEADHIANDLTTLIGDIAKFEADLGGRGLLVAWLPTIRNKWRATLNASMTPQPLIDSLFELELHIHLVAMKPMFYRTRPAWLRKLRSVYGEGMTGPVFATIEESFQELRRGTFMEDPAHLMQTLGLGAEWLADAHGGPSSSKAAGHRVVAGAATSSRFENIKSRIREQLSREPQPSCPAPAEPSAFSGEEQTMPGAVAAREPDAGAQQPQRGAKKSVLVMTSDVVRLQRFFTRYAPHRLSEVRDLLREFHGMEEQLMHALVEEYGPEPEVHDESEQWIAGRQQSIELSEM